MNDEVEKDEHTAVADDTDAETSKSSGEEGGAAQDQDDEGDGLDALLAEFEERANAARTESKSVEPEPKGKPKGDVSDIDITALAQLESRLEQQEAREQRRELEKLYSSLAEGTNGDALDAEAYVYAAVQLKPKMAEIYNERDGRYAREWKRLEKELHNDFRKRHGKKVDKAATEGRDAISSAVRSAQSAAPSEEMSTNEVMTASPDEWAKMQRKLGITPL